MEKNYIITKEQYLAVKAAWKKEPNLFRNIILYNILRSFPPKRGYTAITNPVKLANGMKEWDGFNTAKFWLERSFVEPKVSKWHTPDQFAERTKEYQNLLKPYGLEYDPELYAKIREILNGL